MPNRYTVTVVDTEGDEPSIKRTNSYERLEDALNAVETLSDFMTFEGERIELSGGDAIDAWFNQLEASSDGWDVPEEGEVLNDPRAPHWSEGHVTITEVTNVHANEYEIKHERVSGPTTVADENLDDPENAPVVLGTYVGGSDKDYAFPVTRLERL